MRRPFALCSPFVPAVLLLALGSACASHDGSVTKPEQAPQTQLRASIAAVQLIQDCPDRDPPPTEAPAKAAASEIQPAAGDVAAGSPVQGSAARGVGGGSFEQPCTQSTMQLSLAHDDDQPQRIEVVEVRLLKAGSTDALGKLAARKPSKWSDAGIYDPWDERIPVGSEVKVSYRLGEPDWSKVHETIGTSNDLYAQRWILEVDLKMDGRTTTIRSPEFAREHPHVIVT